MSKKILLVDDEPNILQGFERHLRKSYDLELAVGGAAALEAVKSSGPFAVVVSDMQMPEMSGVELLGNIRRCSEHTVRIMLTGNADQRTVVDAVNEGNIFRFLNKPCPPDKLAQALDAGLEQYRLVTAEAELLSNTLSGSVRLLTQVLSLAMPQAFGLSQKARTLGRSVATRMDVGPMWQVEMAAMLMRLGCVSLPDSTLSKYLSAKPLDADDQKLVNQTPELGYELLSSIPRLEGVAELIRHQTKPPTESTPMASRILKVVGDYQRFSTAESPFSALRRLENGTGYDQNVVREFSEVITENCEIRSVDIAELRPGMVLETRVEDTLGHMLIAKGVEVHEALIQKLSLLRNSGAGVREPIEVRVLKPQLANAGAK